MDKNTQGSEAGSGKGSNCTVGMHPLCPIGDESLSKMEKPTCAWLRRFYHIQSHN